MKTKIEVNFRRPKSCLDCVHRKYVDKGDFSYYGCSIVEVIGYYSFSYEPIGSCDVQSICDLFTI